MDPAETKQEIDKLRVGHHDLRSEMQGFVLSSHQTAQAIPRILEKLDSMKDMMHEHGKETVALRGEIKYSSERTSAAMVLIGVKMDAADHATDAKIDGHLEAHKKWFPIIPTLIVAFVLAIAGAIFALIKKG